MNKFILPLLAALLIAPIACCGKKQAAAGKEPGDGGKSASPKPRNDIEGLPNFAKVSDALYRGAQPSAEGFARLKEMGVKTVVNLRAVTSDSDLMKGLGLSYVHISFKPWHIEEEDIMDFLKIVTDPGNQPVFVHCRHGADRTGTMVAIYRVTVQKWDLEKALSELPNFGFHKVWDNLKDYMREEFQPEEIIEKVRKAEIPKIEVVP